MKIQISTNDNLKSMAEDIVLNVLCNLASSSDTEKGIDKILASVRTVYGDQAYDSIKSNMLNMLYSNVSGLKTFVSTELVDFLTKNNGKKFEIEIVEVKDENNSVQSA